MPFGQTIPFHPLIDLLRHAFGIDEGDREAAIVEKIERGTAELSAGSPARAALRAPSSLRRSRRPGDPPDGREAAAGRDLRRHARILRAPGGAPPAGGRLGGPPLDGPGDGGVHRRAGGRGRRPADARGADVPPRLRAARRRPHVPHAPGADRTVDGRLHGRRVRPPVRHRAAGVASSADRAPGGGEPVLRGGGAPLSPGNGRGPHGGCPAHGGPRAGRARRARHGARRDPGPDPATAGRSAAAPRAGVRRRSGVRPAPDRSARRGERRHRARAARAQGASS